jgi:hypothetical protein
MSFWNHRAPADERLPEGRGVLPSGGIHFPRGGIGFPKGGPLKGYNLDYARKLPWYVQDAINDESDEVSDGVVLKDDKGDEKEPSGAAAAAKEEELDTSGETFVLQDQVIHPTPPTAPKSTSTSESPKQTKVKKIDPPQGVTTSHGYHPDLSTMQLEGVNVPTAAQLKAISSGTAATSSTTRAASARVKTVVIPGSRTHT